MYFKQWSPIPYYRKSLEPCWLQWVHHSEGKTHCQECLMLDGCFFQQGKAPPWPHHPFCHCTLEEVPYAVVQQTLPHTVITANLIHTYSTRIIFISMEKIGHLKVGAILFQILLGSRVKWSGRLLKNISQATIYLENWTNTVRGSIFE